MIKQKDKKELKKFGRKLKQIREKKQLSLRQVSYRCDIDNSKISKIENGSINVTLITIIQLAVALEVHPSELLMYDSQS